MALENDMKKRGLVSEKALADAKSKQKVASNKRFTTFSSKPDAQNFLDNHKSSGGYGYVDHYGSDENGWEVTHWTD